jgi:hypothetical protein
MDISENKQSVTITDEETGRRFHIIMDKDEEEAEGTCVLFCLISVASY